MMTYHDDISKSEHVPDLICHHDMSSWYVITDVLKPHNDMQWHMRTCNDTCNDISDDGRDDTPPQWHIWWHMWWFDTMGTKHDDISKNAPSICHRDMSSTHMSSHMSSPYVIMIHHCDMSLLYVIAYVIANCVGFTEVKKCVKHMSSHMSLRYVIAIGHCDMSLYMSFHMSLQTM